MRILKTMITMVLLTASFMACKKDNDAEPAFAVPGKWEGALIDGSNGATAFYGLLLNADGTLTRYKTTGEILATGNWQLAGDSIKGSYQFSDGYTFSITGLVDKQKKKMTGTWGGGSNTKGLGSWNASKK